MALVLVTGGARCGKSAAAERLASLRAAAGARVVVAVFGSDDGDPEMADRIERHRAGRPDPFETLEATDSESWKDRVADDALLVLECLGTLAGLAISELVADLGEDAPAGALEPLLEERLSATVRWLVHRPGDTIVVTNETGWGVVPAYPSGRVFRDVVGRVNRVLTDVSDGAYLVTNGRVVDLSALPREIPWPGSEE